MKKILKIDREGMPLVDKILFGRYFPEEITDNQAEMMLHALGADNRSYRTYDKRKYYHAYRNYFDAGGTDVEQWDDLVAKDMQSNAGFITYPSEEFTCLNISRSAEYGTITITWLIVGMLY